mgnify:CR=1 FL=1
MQRTSAYPSPRYTLWSQILTALVIGTLLAIAGMVVMVFGFQLTYLGRIYPGISVAGVVVGGLTPAEAGEKINAAQTYPQGGRILLQDGQNGWVASPQELGLFIDPGASATDAFEYGRESGFAKNLSAVYEAWTEGKNMPLTLVFDQRLAARYLELLAAQIDHPVIEADLGVEGGEVVVRSGEVGRKMDIAASLANITTLVGTLQDGAVPLTITETPPVILDASEQAEIARRIISEPLVLALPAEQTAEGYPRTIDQQTLINLLTIERVENGSEAAYQVALSSEQLLIMLNNMAPGLITYPVNARFIFNDDTHQLDLLEPAVIGRVLNVQQSLDAIQDGLKENKHTIELALELTNPPVTSDATAESLGITELVEAQPSYYYGSSADRIQNIKAAASRFHGLLVAPGETFSMATALGDISLDNGYAEALIIVGGQTITGVGGGVCQVSTTLFRTAFFAGFPIVERHAHAYRVYYYEKVVGNKVDSSLAGLDATVYVPIVDFKFTNDTPYWLLMETYVDPAQGRILWKFYSTSDGRTVEWDTTGPVNIVEAPEPLYRENPDLKEGEIKQVDWEAEGADVTVTRWVYKNNELYLKDTIYTHYQPWQAIYEYGPGTEIPTPEASD